MKRVRVIGPRETRGKWKTTNDTVVVNTTSSGGIWSDLSPFKIGPCIVRPLPDVWLQSKTMENAWQFSKVYDQHLSRANKPNKEWWLWAQQGWQDERAHRYPMGKGAKPEYSYWKGEALDYIQARTRIYIPLYAQAVLQTEGWKKLKALHKTKKQVVLRDFDGYDHIAQKKSIDDVVQDQKKKMGHAFVLAMLLEKHPIVAEFL